MPLPNNKLALTQCLDAISITHQALIGMKIDLQCAPDYRIRALSACAIASLGKGLVVLLDARRELLGVPKAGVLNPSKSLGSRPNSFGIAFAQWDDPTLKIADVKKAAITQAEKELKAAEAGDVNLNDSDTQPESEPEPNALTSTEP